MNVRMDGELASVAPSTVPLPSPLAMLHGHVARASSGLARLLGHDGAAARRCPGVVDVVVRADFLAVVARTPELARQAADALRPQWSTAGENAENTLQPPTRLRFVAQQGNAAHVLAESEATLERSYRWPLAGLVADAAGSAVAEWRGNTLHVWLAGARPGVLRRELAALLAIPAEAVTIVCLPDRPSGHDDVCAHHAAADAALLAYAVGRPVSTVFRAGDFGAHAPRVTVRVSTFTPADESGDGRVRAWSVDASLPPDAGIAFALRQTRTVLQPGDVDAVDADSVDDTITQSVAPPYVVANLDATVSVPYDPPALAAARAHVFAQESHLDEAAVRGGIDPVALRLRQLADPTGADLVRRVAGHAMWQPRGVTPAPHAGFRRGRGFAYASVIDLDNGIPVRTWSAWVADVEIDSSSGEVSVTRVVVGHERAAASDEAGARASMLRHDVAEAAHRLTGPDTRFDNWGANADTPHDHHAGADYLPAVPGNAVLPPPAPEINVVGALAGGATATLPAAAAVANAIYDATGVRLREPPFTGERVRLALAEAREKPAAMPPRSRLRKWLTATVAPLAALAGLGATVMPWRAPIAPVAPPAPGFYSAATLERGRLVAAAGDCAVCHTAPHGVRNAGGLALDTPFGTVYSTNITPDAETGIGTWSYAAFERAMREGIHQDGRRLYPVFPYTAFAKVSDADMQALYAHLITAEPVSSRPPETKLAFPFGVRPLLAGWNFLFHRNAPFAADPARSAQWNRGAYLAEGLGHCSACHSPRNALGAERTGKAYLGGGMAEGWEAPPLTALSHAPVPWSESDLFRYLRTGHADRHGAAAGPMAPVIASLRELPESDVRAIAHYVASFGAPTPDDGALTQQAQAVEARSVAAARLLTGPADRVFQNACAVCHQSGQGVPQFGVKPSLALNTNLHGTLPDNVIQALLHGVPAPPHEEIGYMPGFADSLDDAQLAQLVHYLRARFAPDQPAWEGVEADIARIRVQAAH